MDKQIVEYSYNQILLNNKREWTVCYNMDKSPKFMLEKRSPKSKYYSQKCYSVFCEIPEQAKLNL